jgi:catechol 2,3-dioxygenase-like lactoylglutathione lyase family enzyme
MSDDLSTSDVVAFAATTDVDRGRAFYEGVLGLRVVDQDQFAFVLDANGTSVRVSLVERVVPAGYTVLGWTVDDIASTVATLAGRSVRFERFDGMEQDDRGIWTAPGGHRVAWFKDPDGNMLSITEFVASPT